MRKKALKMVAASVAIVVLLFVGYRAYSAWTFSRNLDQFQLELVREGMPGSSRTEILVSSEGTIVLYDTTSGERRLVRSGSLDENAVETIRESLKGLKWMSGPYRRPLWDRERRVANYLDFEVRLSNGAIRRISLGNINPPRTREFMDTFNSVVGSEYHLHFRKD